MGNAVGDFHVGVLGSMQDWEEIPVGNVIDLRNTTQKIIAEVKNKFNTTKGNHKKVIYDDLQNELHKQEYHNFTGYYVEIVPKPAEPYDKPFTPSDNVTHERRPLNEKIRVIDGRSFYDKASQHEGTLEKLYDVLPVVITDILQIDLGDYKTDEMFMQLFRKAYC